MRFRLPKFLRYMIHSNRLKRFVVMNAFYSRKRIIGNYILCASNCFPQMNEVSTDKYLDFSIDATFFNNSKEFRDFEYNLTVLCKKFGFHVFSCWSNFDNKTEYSWSIKPDGVWYNLTNELYEAFSRLEYQNLINEQYKDVKSYENC
jgi:hypothetical protein